MRFYKYNTAEAAYRAAMKIPKIGSRLVIRLPSGKFTHVPIAVGSDTMACIVAKAMGGEVEETVYKWGIDGMMFCPPRVRPEKKHGKANKSNKSFS